MEDSERIETEIDLMLNRLQDLERLLRSRHNKFANEHEMNNISTQIADSARKVDNILNKTDFFDQNEDELEEKLKQLEEEDKRSQSQFEQIKACAERLQETFQQCSDQVGNIKFGDNKNMSLENLF